MSYKGAMETNNDKKVVIRVRGAGGGLESPDVLDDLYSGNRCS